MRQDEIFFGILCEYNKFMINQYRFSINQVVFDVSKVDVSIISDCDNLTLEDMKKSVAIIELLQKELNS